MKGRLPRPEPQQRVRGYRVDFFWPEHRLVVEVDGYEAHSGRIPFQRDRAKDRALRLARYELLRFTWHDVFRSSKTVVREVSTMMGR